MGISTDITLLLPNSHFLFQYSFRTSVDPHTNPLIAMLPETLLSCLDALSDPLLSSCMSHRSALVHCRLGLPATEIDLAYLYKALAFTHLYIPQSCYHKSSCLSTSGHTILTPAILTLSLLRFNPLFNCSLKLHYSQISPKLICLYNYPYLH